MIGATLPSAGSTVVAQRVLNLRPANRGASTLAVGRGGDAACGLEAGSWARNVLAAGRCRMQHQDKLIELDKPGGEGM